MRSHHSFGKPMVRSRVRLSSHQGLNDETKSKQTSAQEGNSPILTQTEDENERIDLARSAQQRFQGLPETETQLASRDVNQDILNLGLGGLGVAALIAGTSIDGMPPALPLIITFLAGYFAIIYESAVDINKSASALIMAVICWCLVGHAGNLGIEQVITDLDKSLASVSQIVFFLMSAMAIVETVDAHDGFAFITDKIRTTDRGALLVIMCITTFFLSSVLDNLTTTIVMCSLLSRLISDDDVETRKVRPAARNRAVRATCGALTRRAQTPPRPRLACRRRAPGCRPHACAADALRRERCGHGTRGGAKEGGGRTDRGGGGGRHGMVVGGQGGRVGWWTRWPHEHGGMRGKRDGRVGTSVKPDKPACATQATG
jgi:hypothetical protein